MAEEREFNLLVKELGIVRPKRNVAELFTVAFVPPAMRPRTHHQRHGCSRRLRLDRTKRLECSGKILRIEPSAHNQHSGFDVLQMRQQVARLPERIVICMADGVGPIRISIMKILLLRVAERAHVEIKPVAVIRSVVELFF